MLPFIILISITSACTTAEKVKCLAAATGCGLACLCDIPVCECCPACLLCVTATAADCCDCLFPGWSGCNNNNATYKCSNIRCNGIFESVCCPRNQRAICECSIHGESICRCYELKSRINSCANIRCNDKYRSVCCISGHIPSCDCISNNPVCTCA